jgi:hypothetical protein
MEKGLGAFKIRNGEREERGQENEWKSTVAEGGE